MLVIDKSLPWRVLAFPVRSNQDTGVNWPSCANMVIYGSKNHDGNSHNAKFEYSKTTEHKLMADFTVAPFDIYNSDLKYQQLLCRYLCSLQDESFRALQTNL